MNMNDCCREAAYFFSEEDRDKLQILVQTARQHCTQRSESFINDAKFYRNLWPEYAQLVPLYRESDGA